LIRNLDQFTIQITHVFSLFRNALQTLQTNQ
jgi:hypothetical protein